MDNQEQRLDKAVVDAIRARDTREQGYRAQSLKIHPWVCGRCGREFNEKNLYELTVHHKDHNHDNNPPDGSNWENLCIYCCLLYTSPSPRDRSLSRMPSSA